MRWVISGSGALFCGGCFFNSFFGANILMLVLSKTVYIICGPTGAGKTAIAIQLAQRLGTAVISADSRQCYTEMTIGTAKPSPAELKVVKHYFIDEFPVTRFLSAADFELMALNYLDEIFATHDAAIVCGGTGLYIKALCDGLDEMPPTDPVVVRHITDEYSLRGFEWLREAVKKEDPEFYSRGEIHNPARMLRALSFIRTTGTSILQHRTETKKQRSFNIIKAGLELPREILYSRINERTDKMMEQGLLAEVEKLYPYKALKNLQTVGYSELFEYMDGEMNLPEAVDKIKQHTRNYAKRQLTWFKKDKDIKWYNANDNNLAEKISALS